MSFDINKPYRTRSGMQAKAVAAPDGRLYGYLVMDSEVVSTDWEGNGRWWEEWREDSHPNDLVNSESVVVWVVIDKNGKAYGYPYEQVLEFSRDKVVAQVKREITYTAGEGL